MNRVGHWIPIAKTTDCPADSGVEVVVAGRIIALFHWDGNYYALDGVCPHHGGPLGQGALNGCVVTCPWHGWQFDVTNGRHQASKELTHPTYPTKVEAGQVWIQLDVESQ